MGLPTKTSGLTDTLHSNSTASHHTTHEIYKKCIKDTICSLGNIIGDPEEEIGVGGKMMVL
jgi:hypothetical protein